MSELIIQNIKKTYKKNTVVKDISLRISSGEVIGLLGPNGAGKTTSFYMIVGLIPSEHGTIKIDNHNLTKMAIHRRSKLGISYLPQEPSIFRKMTVSENILSILELQKSTKKQNIENLEILLNELSINHIKNNTSISLSGGERRRVEIARCLATNPKFILLDEPFAGIDPIAVSDLKQTIKQLKSKNIGVLISDHNVRDTMQICDQVLIINQGNLIAQGVPEEVSKDPLVKDVYLGKDFKQ